MSGRRHARIFGLWILSGCWVGSVFSWDPIPAREIPAWKSSTEFHPGFSGRQEGWDVYTETEERADEILARLKAGAVFLNKRIGPLPAGRRFVLVETTSEEDWRKLTAGRLDVEEGAAFQDGDSLFLFRRLSGESRYLAVFHELVHLYFHVHVPNGLPLWIEEGAAQRYGWLMAADYYEDRGVELERHPPRLLQAFSMESLMNIRSYPVQDEKLSVFYRCAEVLAEAVLNSLSRSQEKRMWRELAGQSKSFTRIMELQFRWGQREWDWIGQEYERGIGAGVLEKDF